MKKSFLTLLLGALAAIPATAGPTEVTSVGIGGTWIVTLDSVSHPTSLTFSNLGGPGEIFSLGCAGRSSALCNPVGGGVTVTSTTWGNASGGEQFTFASGLMYSTTPGFSVDTLPGGGFFIHTTGDYYSDGTDSTIGKLDFLLQFPTDGSNAPLGLYSFSASGGTIPEPGSLVLLGSGLIGLGMAARRRFAK